MLQGRFQPSSNISGFSRRILKLREGGRESLALFWRNCSNIKLQSPRHHKSQDWEPHDRAVTEQSSWVSLPSCPLPRRPFPIKSLAFSAQVSPGTIHFLVLDKSPLWGPGRGPISETIWPTFPKIFTIWPFTEKDYAPDLVNKGGRMGSMPISYEVKVLVAQSCPALWSHGL